VVHISAEAPGGGSIAGLRRAGVGASGDCWQAHEMAYRVALRSAPTSPRSGAIEFSGAGRRDGGFICVAALMLDGEEWSVELDMISPYVAAMVGFFEEMADAADGWPDVKAWESEFDELTIWARNEGTGLVALDVRLRSAGYEDDIRSTFEARAEELPRVAEEMRDFARMERGSRGFNLRPIE
jgi:hypothetical protein